jgi:hypothetical protein
VPKQLNVGDPVEVVSHDLHRAIMEAKVAAAPAAPTGATCDCSVAPCLRATCGTNRGIAAYDEMNARWQVAVGNGGQACCFQALAGQTRPQGYSVPGVKFPPESRAPVEPRVREGQGLHESALDVAFAAVGGSE